MNLKKYLKNIIKLIEPCFFLGSILIFFLITIPEISEDEYWLDILSNFRFLWFIVILLLLVQSTYLKYHKSSIILVIGFIINGYYIEKAYPLFKQNSVESEVNENRGSINLNILHFNTYVNNIRGSQEFIQFVREENFDIIVLLEVNHYWRMVVANLEKDYPYMFEHKDKIKYRNIIFLSKVVFDVEGVYRPDKRMPLVHLKMPIARQDYQLFLLHALSPKSKQSFNQRNQYLDNFLEIAKPYTHQIIIGDINNTPFSKKFQNFMERGSYRALTTNSFKMSTWPSFFSFLPIDHIFISKEIDEKKTYRGPRFYSDHHSIISELSLPL